MAASNEQKQQHSLLRGYVLRKLREIKIFVSMLPERDEAALQALSSVDRVARITDDIMRGLGHDAGPMSANGSTVRAARKVVSAES